MNKHKYVRQQLKNNMGSFIEFKINDIIVISKMFLIMIKVSAVAFKYFFFK